MICSISQAQTPLPYFTGFDNSAEKAGWTEYKLGVNSDPYKWEYASFSAFSSPNCLRHDYPVGGSQQTDDWFVSPQFDFSSGASIDSLRYAFTGFGTPNAGDTIGIYLLSGSQNPAQASSITMLYSFTDSTYLNDNIWYQMGSLSIPAGSGASYIAFRYTTVVNWLDVRLDNLQISANNVGWPEVRHTKPDVLLYPNPVHGVLNVEIKDQTTGHQQFRLELYDMVGTLVMIRDINSEDQLEVSGLRGMYVYQIWDLHQAIIARGKLMAD